MANGKDSNKNDYSCYRKCFGNLTKLEACLITLCLLLLAALMAVCVFWLVILEGHKIFTEKFPTWADHSTLLLDSRLLKRNFKNETVCTSRQCTLVAGLFTLNLKETVDPCDDFFEFACGNYEMSHDLSVDKPIKHTIGDTTSRLKKQVKSVLEEPIDSKKDSHWDIVTKIYYHNCLDEEALRKTGLKTLIELMDSFGGWPVLYGDTWNVWNHSWEHQLALVTNRTGMNGVIMDIGVVHDSFNSSINVIEVEQTKFGMQSRYYYLNEHAKPMLQNYTNLMISVAVQMGANETVARRDMEALVQFESDLAAITVKEELRRDPWRSYNPYQLWQVTQKYPKIDLAGFIRSVFPKSVQILDNDTIIVAEVDYMDKLQNITSHTPKRVIANYILWRLVLGFSIFLPKKLRETFTQFQANKTGMPLSAVPPRWEDCVSVSTMILDMPVGAIYVKHFFEKEKTMLKMDELASYLKEAFIDGLNRLDWMDSKTKQLAIEKVNTIEYKTGFPEWFFNQTAMHINWGWDSISRTEPLLTSTIRLKLRRVNKEMARLKMTPDKSIWYQSPAQVDAYYAPSLNQMIFPAGIMQFPFLVPGAPNYIIFAMAGAVVGHEVSHAFDDQGGRYDQYGNLKDWWTATSGERFRNKAQCFVQQYGNITVPGTGGVNLNGRISLGENIADNAGVKTAYQAYKLWQKKHPDGEPRLPGLDKYNADQLFFMAYANNWCSMVRKQYYKQLVMNDFHSPPKYRALVPLRNVPHFSQTFNCPLGSPMNPEQKCTIW